MSSETAVIQTPPVIETSDATAIENPIATVTAGPMNENSSGGATWSATRLKSLMLCPRQFRYAYVDLIPAVPTAPLVFGRVVHQALLFVHQQQMRENCLPPVTETLSHFDALWQQALEEENPFFRSGAHSPGQHTQLGHEILRGYLRFIEGTKPPLAAELSFEIAVGNDTLRGVIDRIDEQDEGLVIVDFKSGSRKLSQSEVERDLQLTVYAFAAQQLYGRPTARVAQFYLRDGTYLRSLRGPEDFAWLLADILPYARRVLREEQYPARVGYWCNWCDFRELCKAERSQNVNSACGSVTALSAVGGEA